MNIREKILVIEDEKSIAHFISTILTANGYDAMRASSGAEAMSMISSHCPDLVILDLGLPDMDGLDILRQIRSWSTLPVVVVSARSHEQDKVSALDLGADDYLAKPFGMMELVARAKALLRRTAKRSAGEEFRLGMLYVSLSKHLVMVEGEEVTLTNKEFSLLTCLLQNQGRVLTRDQLLNDIWGYSFDGENRTVDVHIRTLRHKLGDAGQLIKTVRGVGYKIGGEPSERETV